MMLSPRLGAVALLLRPGRAMVDVGSDHARVCVHALRSGCPRVLATDVRPGPLAAARRALEPFGERAAVMLCDGLTGVPPEYDDIVVAGMGGETIVAILAAAPRLRDGEISLVLQPMTRAATLRRWLYANGFYISRELLAQEGRHFYSVMQARFGPCPRPSDAELDDGVALEAFAGADLPAYYRMRERIALAAREGRARAAKRG